MLMMPEVKEIVIGVDTHRDTHTAAVIDPITSAVIASYTIQTTITGYQELIERVAVHGRARVWAIEGTRTYGVGLVRMLLAAGEVVSEADRPKRPTRRSGKNDEIDAIRAGREALGHIRITEPRQGSHRDAIAAYLVVRHSAVEVSTIAQTQLKALIVTSPDEVRCLVRGRSKAYTWHGCEQLQVPEGASIETEATVIAMVALAKRIVALTTRRVAGSLRAQQCSIGSPTRRMISSRGGMRPRFDCCTGQETRSLPVRHHQFGDLRHNAEDRFWYWSWCSYVLL